MATLVQRCLGRNRHSRLSQQWVTVGAVARYSARQVAPAGLLVVGLGFLGLDSLDSPTS